MQVLQLLNLCFSFSWPGMIFSQCVCVGEREREIERERDERQTDTQTEDDF